MQRGEDYPPGSRFVPGAFPSSSSSDTFHQTQTHTHPHQHHPEFIENTYAPQPPLYYTPRDDLMEIDSPYRWSPTTPPRSLTHQRGVKRAAEEAAEELQAQRLQDPQQPPTRRVAGMLTTIPHQIWAASSNAFTGFLNYFRPAQVQTQAQPQPTTYIDALETDESGRKRRAVDVTHFGTPHRLRDSEGDSEPMFAPRPAGEIDAGQKARDRAHEKKRQEELETVKSSFNKSVAQKEIERRARWHKEYYGSQNVDRLRVRPKQLPTIAQPTTHTTTIPLRDRQVSALVAKAHRAQGGSFAQKAAAYKAAREAEAKAEREQLAKEREEARIEAEKEAARIEAERIEAARIEEEARKRAEEEAARAQEIIIDLPQAINTQLQNSLNNNADDRSLVTQLGSIPLQKLTFKRILASDRGTENWLDDDAVNAWFNSIVEAKKRQTNYVKSDTNPPTHVNLQTAWYEKQKKDGIASLKRWMKRAGVNGVNIFKCERLFLPINMGSHWTLLIINGTTTSIEYLDSLGGDGARFFKLARDLLKAELGDKYDAQKWKDSKRSRSSKQDNGSDCGVFTCFNGLAAAKDMAYKEVTAKKMPAARQMMAGVLISGGFAGDFDL
jgi:sentrin-specific protease 1